MRILIGIVIASINAWLWAFIHLAWFGDMPARLLPFLLWVGFLTLVVMVIFGAIIEDFKERDHDHY